MNFFSILSLPFVVYFFTTITAAIIDHKHGAGDVSINCGSTGNFASVDGREWIGDGHKKVSSSIQITGSSTSTSVAGESMVSADEAQYKTARISRSRFSYKFHLSPGQKFIILHFNPVPYRGFKGLKDLLTVEAGPFLLLGNFSASLTADALGRNEKSFAKEFCINIEENQPLDIVFYPDQRIRSRDGTYAFINGIEIISVPTHLSYFRSRAQVDSLKSLVHIYDYNHTALEIIHRQNVKPSDDFVNMFRVRTTTPKGRTNKLKNNTWKIAVDVRFRYLVRIHFCEFGLKIAKETQMNFKIFISEIRVDDNIQLVDRRENNDFLQYRDYITTIQGQQDSKHNLLVSTESNDELMNRNGPFKGFEILKLSNLDNSLASPNPQPPARDLSFPTAQNLIRVCGEQNIIVTAAVIVFALVNIIIYKLRQLWEDNFTEDEKKPSARARRLCRRFSLAEIEAATQNFNHELVIGNGGFGRVYKGIIDNGQETVAIKRLKYSSNQGAREFWTEIDTLSELRHVDLVSLIGYCNEQLEMILVYEYMIHGTLSDHLFKQATRNNHSSSLSWNQCLNICIGAGRGLDYLHTGHGIIHRDVKASNILLDKHFIAKVSDFGLAKPENICESQGHASTNVKGTPGHIDPYYIRTHKPTMKSDVYAFGVVLLEVLCGRPALDPRLEEDQRSLATWFRENIGKGDTEKIISSNIRREILPDSLKAFVRLVIRCLDDEPKKRPTMAQVVLQLEFALDLQDKPNFLVFKETSTANLSPVDEYFRSAKASNKEDMEESTSGRNELELDNGTRASLAEDCAMEVEVTKFDWKTIQDATFGFYESRIIGRGDGATVYKAVLPTRQVVAVAVKRADYSPIKDRMIKLEVYCLSKYKHPNIMKLLQYFIHDTERILVYEFIENTSLDAILFGKRLYRLSWRLYFKIIIGIARGLSCLHRHSEHRKYYCNLEPCNIFLDSDLNPKIAINYFKTESNTAISTRDYTPLGGHEASQMFVSDIYKFGVMVLEIVSGKKHSLSVEHQNLIKMVRKLWSGNKLLELVCTTMGNEFSRVEATRCIKVALLCTQSEPARRPDIYAVLGALQGDQALEVEMREAEIGLLDP